MSALKPTLAAALRPGSETAIIWHSEGRGWEVDGVKRRRKCGPRPTDERAVIVMLQGRRGKYAMKLPATPHADSGRILIEETDNHGGDK